MKILHLDIETAPHLAMVWGLYNQNVGINMLEKPGYTLCWAAKWHGKNRVMSAKHTDEHCFTDLHALLEEASAVVTYNGGRFDLPTLNKEFLLRGMTPPAPYKSIDLYQTVKRRFKFASNKLDFVCQQLGLGAKVVHKGFDLWRGCMEGDADSWKDMLAYNKQDVRLLEPLFIKLQPWLIASVRSGCNCPACGSGNLEKRGFVQTPAGSYQRYRCNKCGKWSRDGINLTPLKGHGKRSIAA